MLTIDPTDIPLLPNTLAPVANILVTAIPVAVVLPVEFATKYWNVWLIETIVLPEVIPSPSKVCPTSIKFLSVESVNVVADIVRHSSYN